MFHGGTLIFIQTWFSHINAYASICALHLDEYPNLAGRWRSISNKAIQPEVQLAGTLLQISCCFASAAAATLVLAFVSVCRAAASAAAAATRHATCLFIFFFMSCTTLSSDCRAGASAAAAAARHAGCVCSSFFFGPAQR